MYGVNGGIIGYTFANNIVIKNVYTTETNKIAGGRYSGAISIENGIIVNNGIYTVDYMKSIDFINELNSYIQENSDKMNGCSKWEQDNKNTNEGYPIFEWQ